MTTENMIEIIVGNNNGQYRRYEGSLLEIQPGGKVTLDGQEIGWDGAEKMLVRKYQPQIKEALERLKKWALTDEEIEELMR